MESECKHKVDIGRRKFLAKLVVGSTLFAGGGIASYFNFEKMAQQKAEVEREVREQGITPANQEALRLSRQIRLEKGEDIQSNRSISEIQIAREAEAQQEAYDQLVRKRAHEKRVEGGPSDLEVYGGIVATGVGEVSLFNTVYNRTTRVEVLEQNVQQPETPPNK